MSLPNTSRIVSIDAVRGFAVLGILLMNIVGMGMPAFAYIDPTHYGGHEGANLWVWATNFVLSDGKMRGLFTILFGASALLIAERAEGGALSPVATHYRRMFWLLVFGMLHAYLLWVGDILVCYSLAGLVLFPFLKLKPRTLILIGSGLLLALLAFSVWNGVQLEALKHAAEAPGASKATRDAWEAASITVIAPAGFAEAQLAGFGGGFMEALAARSQMALLFQTAFMPTSIVEAVGQMLIGAALFKSGFFTLRWSSRAYWTLMAVGYLVGVPATAWLAYWAASSGFDPMVLHDAGTWSALPRPFIGLAHACVILLIVRVGALSWLMDRLSAAGRMALSNYLMTSIITAFLFCGFGLGLYGELERAELYWVVLGVWVFILAWSKPWLERFRYGPFEWAWRSLVQWRVQKLRGPAAA
jgi:uncharacterized protein